MYREYLEKAIRSLDKEEIIDNLMFLIDEGYVSVTTRFMCKADISYSVEDLLRIWKDRLEVVIQRCDEKVATYILADAASLCYEKVPEDGKEELFPVVIKDLYRCYEDYAVGMYLRDEDVYLEYAYLMRKAIDL